ncbi:site-specific DNA-methyltransferase [Clostridium botulinum]|uniref:Methyltransferase n=1 Tax=Clostridium botulinum TaxID=1491 RepID=A0A6M0T2J9_CLOBO|nr:site-specific DNA-methyltransferase [Clostridium botulinum]NFI74465.1 site-specific DNA-methyltransferase [Clostridium sporogenes]NFP62373.1 site-specific DNA-methyltransferase [Clostridium sporogenes]NFU95475.1 site-specific DNA-methyltransferase [Clostridium sporogenes]NFV68205.1 site-specific DNA-methyltransferase [Clostridium botulinum]
MLEVNNIYLGNCLEIMKKIDDKSIDMVLSDLPFGMTNNEWDKAIPFEPMWQEINRIAKDNASIALMAAGVFTSELVVSNKKYYRYSWIWKPKEKSNFLNANRMPLRQHINIPIFYKSLPVYNPQKTYGHKPVKKYKQHTTAGANYGKTKIGMEGGGQTDRYPTTIIDIPYNTIKIKDRIHPTQKPVELYEYLIKTYTNEEGIALDFTAGSCVLAEACINTNRNYICIEKEKKYCNKAKERIKLHLEKGKQLKII